MQAPNHLPEALIKYQACQDERALFHALSSNLHDVLAYFEAACCDRQWAQRHPLFLRLVLRWAAKNYYLGLIARPVAEAFVAVIRAHIDLFFPFLFFRSALFLTVKLKIEGQIILANSFLLGVCSLTLDAIFRRECFAQWKDEWEFPNISLSVFRIVENFAYHGEVRRVETLTLSQFQQLKQLAADWHIEALLRKLCYTNASFG